ncbi:hypothetical protein [Pontibacter cellulosilyticus]|nr:hypothetical protein [Pontibacter cellulosilyticus]
MQAKFLQQLLKYNLQQDFCPKQKGATLCRAVPFILYTSILA